MTSPPRRPAFPNPAEKAVSSDAVWVRRRNCFMMPERMAKTPASEQVKETIGSGPFRFLPGEWVSGARAGYARFDGYVPRQEAPSFYAGGKVANFERVEWIVQPDSATAAAALQKGEVDWVEQPLIDLCPMLRTFARRGGHGERSFRMAADHRAQSSEPAVRQPEAAARAAAGARPEDLYLVDDRRADRTRPCARGLFRRRSTDGDACRPGRADPAARSPLAKRLVAEAGYQGEPVVLLSPSDRPVYSAVSQVARDLFQKIGLTVDFQAMDWGSVVTRRTSQNPTDKGGWSAFITALDGVTVSNPGGNFALRGNGKKAWFGWPTDDKLESLRDAWFDAPDLKSQKAIAEQIQLRGLEILPYIPLGQFFQPTAFRSDIKDIVKAMYPLFWGVRRG